jgi:protein-L-isoaspartate(D-aspartate) O-methyltransferase
MGTLADADNKTRVQLLRRLRREVSDERVLAAIAAVPRERFVPARLQARAYDDVALPIGHEQTISQPTIVAVMLEALAVAPADHVLDVGTGSGYQAALLSRLAARVTGVERLPGLVDDARHVLHSLTCDNVEVHLGLGELGWPRAAPYDGIVVAAAAPSVPDALVRQLRVGGRLVMPVGTPFEQNLVVLTRVSVQGDVSVCWLGPCRFVPLIGEGGWPTDS